MNHSKYVHDHTLSLCNNTVKHIIDTCKSVNIQFYDKKLQELEEMESKLPTVGIVDSFLQINSKKENECHESPSIIYKKCQLHIDTLYEEEKTKATIEHIELIDSIFDKWGERSATNTFDQLDTIMTRTFVGATP